MRHRFGLLPALMFTLALAAGSACGGASTSGAASNSSPGSGDKSSSSVTASDSSSAQSSPSGAQLDAAVKMPAGFPADFPVYGGIRLTKQAQVNSNGQTTWFMTWETLDAIDRVGQWYLTALDQGDWTLSAQANSNGSYGAMFTRRSNSNISGILSVATDSGVTKIDISLGGGQ